MRPPLHAFAWQPRTLMAQHLFSTDIPNRVTEAVPSRRAASLADRLVKHFLVREDVLPNPASAMAFPSRPTQLSLPLGDQGPGNEALALPSLFRDARRIGPVLSYEQASLDQIIPNTTSPPGAPQDRLMQPGSIGLILHDGTSGALAFDWMHWGEAAEAGHADASTRLEPTLSLTELRKNGRAARKLAKRRCIIPLIRYSVPVRDGDVWAHRWISPSHGQVACAAGIWVAERGERPRFSVVTSDMEPLRHGEPGGPLLLAESELLTWLRAPLRDVLARIGRSGAP